MKGNPIVDWYGPVFSSTGYGRHARELALRLYDRSVDISVHHRGERHSMDLPKSQQQKLEEMASKPSRNQYNPELNREAIEVWVLNPAHALCNMQNSLWDPEVHSVNLTVYEAEQVPHPWVSIAEQFDEVWVPAQFAQDSFENAGVDNDFHVMPEGADLSRFDPRGDHLYEMEGFTILSVFDFTYRKGWDVLLEAYCKEFSEFEDTTLLLHTHYANNTDEDRRRVKNKLDEISEQYGGPDYKLSFGYIDEEDFPRLYRSADVFALATRGEGFGLPLFEAAASGLGVITTDYGAPPEYLGNNVYWGDIKGTKPYPLEEAVQHEPNCTGLEFGEPSVMSFRKQLRKAYLDWNKGDLPSPDVSSVNWDAGADKVEDRLQAIWSEHY